MRHLLICALVATVAFLSPTISRAGIWEIGASGSYRRQNIDVDAVDEAQSLTGSLSYYLDEASALELSYTDGITKRSISPTVINGHITMSMYKAVGLDFIYTFAGGAIKPYVKAGALYFIQKKIVDQYLQAGNNWKENTIESPSAVVPSVGVGFKLGLTTALSLKFGMDASTSDSITVQPMKVDIAGRAGMSWMF